MRVIAATAGTLAILICPPLLAAEPDCAVWNALLTRYYHPDHGMDYRSLQERTDVHSSEHVRSIRDLSTDPFIRLNVFKKKRARAGGILMSLDEIEHEKIRKPFRDPRIHFAINCAAKSCPPILGEAFVGSRIDEQLDDQVRRFAAGAGLRVASRGGTTTVTTTKIMKWFVDDFDRWSGGAIAFLRRYMPPEKLRIVTGARDVEIEFDDYDWSLNDWKRRP